MIWFDAVFPSVDLAENSAQKNSIAKHAARILFKGVEENVGALGGNKYYAVCWW